MLEPGSFARREDSSRNAYSTVMTALFDVAKTIYESGRNCGLRHQSHHTRGRPRILLVILIAEQHSSHYAFERYSTRVGKNLEDRHQR